MTFKTDQHFCQPLDYETNKPRNFRFNEKTFTLGLFIFSLSIVLAKLAMHYGVSQKAITYLDLSNDLDTSRIIGLPVNATIEYANLLKSTAVDYFTVYYWLFKALMSGIGITAFTWFIIYKDSEVPGVIPPLPFSSYSPKDELMDINYLVGLLIGMVVFVFMCF